MKCWLMKSEPDVFSIDDLERDRRTTWEGVRNYQARNSMRDDMKLGDLVFYYHSNADPSGIAGIARVVKEAYPDPTQFDRKSDYYDERAKKDAPPWCMVDLEFVEKFGQIVPLEALKHEAALADMLVVQKGQRLSVQLVREDHFRHVLKMAHAKTKLRSR